VILEGPRRKIFFFPLGKYWMAANGRSRRETVVAGVLARMWEETSGSHTNERRPEIKFELVSNEVEK
jgi:hypothetical protein